jgi:hypothetical protein
MISSCIRIAGVVLLLSAAYYGLVAKSHDRRLAIPGQRDAEWVHTADGWERPSWQNVPHRPGLHPGLVATFIGFASLAFLIAAAPSRKAAQRAKLREDVYIQGPSKLRSAIWLPKVVRCEDAAD